MENKRMKRWLVLWGLILALLITACGGDNNGDKDNNTGDGSGGAGGQPVATPVFPTRVPPPRTRPQPVGEPVDFEAPFSVGQFVRQTTQGRSTATRTGGLQAIYNQDQTSVSLNVYYFDTLEQAVETVKFALGSATIKQMVATPEYFSYASYGVAQDRHGAYIVAWSNEKWAFLVRTSGDLNTLNSFLDAFPY
jgi:hypothetical protein